MFLLCKPKLKKFSRISVSGKFPRTIDINWVPGFSVKKKCVNIISCDGITAMAIIIQNI